MRYRLELGLSTRLIKYENCILYIDVHIGSRWKKPPYKTAMEIANNWKNIHPELNGALGAKIFIIELKDEFKSHGSDIKINYKKGILFNFWNKN